PPLVRRVERVCDVAQQVDGARGLERRVRPQQPPEVRAFDVAHRDVEEAVRLAGAVHREDVRVLERGRNLRLGQEPTTKPVVAGELRREQLQRDLTLEPQVCRTVDDAHPASADELLDAVAEQLGSYT